MVNSRWPCSGHHPVRCAQTSRPCAVPEACRRSSVHKFTAAAAWAVGGLVPRSQACRPGCSHRYSLPRAFFLRCSFQTHLEALRTLSALLCFKVGLSEPLHQVILADLPCLSATETMSTTWTSCDQSCSHSSAC